MSRPLEIFVAIIAWTAAGIILASLVAVARSERGYADPIFRKGMAIACLLFMALFVIEFCYWPWGR